MKPYYFEDGITIYNAKCEKVFPQLIERVDVVLTDPPREETIQIALEDYCWQYSHPIRLPNSNVLGWESDMIGVTKAGIMHEYEIKLTLADFKADMKKERHQHIERFRRGEKFYEKKYPWGTYKCDVLLPANYFWYVVPKELASKIILPEYAGLLVIQTGRAIIKETPAPRMHREKITEKQLWQMVGSACRRFWSARRILTKHGIPFTENHENNT